MTPIWPRHTLGKPDRPALLFLHGFMGSAQDWKAVAQICAQDYFCILVDLPGHGQNIHLPLKTRLDFKAWSQALVSLADQLDLKSVCLIGYSLGGRLALHAALNFPTRWAALILEGCNPGIEDSKARQARLEEDEQRAADVLQEGMQAFVDRWYEMELFSSLRRLPDLMESVNRERVRNDSIWMAKVLRELSPAAQPNAWQQLAALHLPALLIAGELDIAYGAVVRRMQTQLPDAQTLILPAAGHNAHLERPQAFAGALLDFLDDVFKGVNQ